MCCHKMPQGEHFQERGPNTILAGLWQWSFINLPILLQRTPAAKNWDPYGWKADSQVLFNLTEANERQLPVKTYIELDINFLGLKKANVGFPILEEPNGVLDRKHHTKLPGIIDWHLIQLVYQVFTEKYWGRNLTPLNVWGELIHSLFSQLCLYHYAEVSKEHDFGMQSIYHQTNKDIKSIPSKLAHLANKSPTIFS